MEALEVSLAPGWSPQHDGGTPDDAIHAVSARLRLRIGQDGLVPHLPALPVAAVLLELCRALSALAGRLHQRALVGLDGDLALILDLADDGLRVSLKPAQGAPLLDSFRVPPRPLVASVLATGRGFLARLAARTPALVETALARSLSAALDGLDGQHMPPPGAAPVDLPRSTAVETDGIAITHSPHDGLRVRLGRWAVDIDDCPLEGAAEALVQVTRDAITTRNWPPGRHLVPIDPAGHRSFALIRSDDGLGLTVVDAASQPLGPALLIRRTALAWAAWRALSGLGPRCAEHTEALLRLLRWARAIEQPVGPAAAAPPDWQGLPASDRPAAADPLPVAGLHHLAWRRAWRREAPGLLRVEEGEDALLLYDDAGLTVLQPRTGTPRWQRPGLRPLERPAPWFAVDLQGTLLALRSLDGRTRWQSALEADPPVIGIQVTPAGLVARTDATIIGLDHRGQRRWRYDAWYGHILGLTSRGPLCWALAEDGFLHGVRVRDGARQFVRPLLGEAEPGLWLTPAGVLLTSTEEPGGRACAAMHHPVTGQLIWRVRCDGGLSQAPTIADGRVFVLLRTGDRCALEARRLSDGGLIWRHGRLSAGRLCHLHHVVDLLCLKSADGGVLALDEASGAVRWRLAPDDTEESLASNTPPVSRRGVLLVPGATIRVLDPATGRLIQTLDCGELLPDWLHVWPNGDFAVAEDDAVVRYGLGGHLALVR